MGQRRKNGRVKSKHENSRLLNCRHQTREDEKYDKINKDDANTNLLPSWTPLAVVTLTLAFRVYYVIDSTSWWILHPDEIFQSMEVAHTELYGYGLRPFEYIPPVKGSNLSHYMLRERTLGMNALRSPLFPQFFILVSMLTSWIGLEFNPYLLWRTSHVMVSSFLPLSVYIYVKVVSRSTDVASLSSILVAVCAQLNIVGTHSLVNSFVSPFLFLALSRTMTLLTQEVSSDKVKGREDKSVGERGWGVSLVRFLKEKISGLYFYLKTELLHHNVCWKARPRPKQIQHRLLSTTSPDISNPLHNCQSFENVTKHSTSQDREEEREMLANGRHTSSNDDLTKSKSTEQNNKYLPVNGTNPVSKTSQTLNNPDTKQDQFDQYCHYNRQSGLENCNGDLTAKISHEVNNNEMKQIYPSAFLSGTNCTECLEGDERREENQIESNSLKNSIINFLSGFILVLCIYIRPDLATFVAIILVTNHKPSQTISLLLRKSSMFHLGGGVLGLSLAVVDDFYFYEGVTLTPLNWVKFNLFSGLTPRLFGTSGKLFYIRGIFLQDFGMSVASVCFLGLFLSYVLKLIFSSFNFITGSESVRFKQPDTVNSELFCTKLINSLCSTDTFNTHSLCVVLLTCVYSFIGHKEYRFLHDTVVLFLLTVSHCIIMTLNVMRSSQPIRRFILFFIVFTFSTIQWQSFQKVGDKNVKTWPFTAHEYGRDVNQCLHYLSNRNDVTGLYLESSIQATASFSILHKNVPLFFKLGKEFLEFDNSFVITGNRSCLMDDNCTMSYYSLNTVSDLIHTKNVQHLLKRLVESKSYNYAILKSDMDFLHPGFDKVFTTQTMSIWRRGYRPEDEVTLAAQGSRIPEGGWNVTVQEYEAEVLKQLGNYGVALTRFQTAFARGLDTSSVRASMAYCLQKMGYMERMSHTLRKCSQKYPKKDCLDGFRPRVLKLGTGFRSEAEKDLM